MMSSARLEAVSGKVARTASGKRFDDALKQKH
jgi:hypothetical protein